MQHFEAIEGGRKALERQLMWAAALDRPTFTALLRRLTPCANDALSYVSPGSDESEPLRRSGAAADGCRIERPDR